MDFLYEKNLKKQGYGFIMGVDEVGVGPLAGNVTACAVTIFSNRRGQSLACRLAGGKGIQELKDSKKLTPKKREEFYKIFNDNPDIVFAVASVTPKIIDKINIYEARRLSAKRAVLKLEKILGKKSDMILLDGRTVLNVKREQRAIVKGDEKIVSCAAASVVAKVTRDRAMLRLHKKYPKYRFDLHKGYGTKTHFKMLKVFGPSPAHRKSFNLFKTLDKNLDICYTGSKSKE